MSRTESPATQSFHTVWIAVARILGDGTRQRTRTFSELQSHYLFEDRFGRPGKGNDKGSVEGTIGYGRRNFLVPMPRFDSFDDLNARLEEQCLKRQDEVLRGHSETIGERLMRDLDALMTLPLTPYDACEKVRPGRRRSRWSAIATTTIPCRSHTPITRSRFAAMSTRSSSAAARKSSPATSGPTKKRTWSSIRCTSCLCWNRRRRA